MSNEVENCLRFSCKDKELLNYIKLLLFGDKEITEAKLDDKLVSPKIQNDEDMHSLYVLNQKQQMKNEPNEIIYLGWKGKDLITKEHNDSLFITYLTDSTPNKEWVVSLLKKIKEQLNNLNSICKDCVIISVEYRYLFPAENKAGIIKWNSEKGFQFSEYDSIQLYLWLYDPQAYDEIVRQYCPDNAVEAFKLYTRNWND